MTQEYVDFWNLRNDVINCIPLQQKQPKSFGVRRSKMLLVVTTQDDKIINLQVDENEQVENVKALIEVEVLF